MSSDTPKGYCRAVWAGASAVSINGTILQPGDEWVIPESEACESGNWKAPHAAQSRYDKAIHATTPESETEPETNPEPESPATAAEEA